MNRDPNGNRDLFIRQIRASDKDDDATDMCALSTTEMEYLPNCVICRNEKLPLVNRGDT